MPSISCVQSRGDPRADCGLLHQVCGHACILAARCAGVLAYAGRLTALLTCTNMLLLLSLSNHLKGIPINLTGIVRDVEGVRHLAELGVVFLLFNIGLELSLERLRSMQKFVFGLGGLQVGRRLRCKLR